MTTFPIVSSLTPRNPGLYLIFDGNPELNTGTLIDTQTETGSFTDAPVSWREEGTGIWSLGPFIIMVPLSRPT